MCSLVAYMVFAILLTAPPEAPAPAPAPSSVPLHLDDALALARQKNFDLLSAGEDARIAEAGLQAAREWPNPSVSGLTAIRPSRTRRIATTTSRLAARFIR